MNAKDSAVDLFTTARRHGLTDADIRAAQDAGRARYDDTIYRIAESQMVRTPGEAPIEIERQINNHRIAMNHPLMLTSDDFERRFRP